MMLGSTFIDRKTKTITYDLRVKLYVYYHAIKAQQPK